MKRKVTNMPHRHFERYKRDSQILDALVDFLISEKERLKGTHETLVDEKIAQIQTEYIRDIETKIFELRSTVI